LHYCLPTATAGHSANRLTKRFGQEVRLRRPKIRDVAARAGVAVSTVSVVATELLTAGHRRIGFATESRDVPAGFGHLEVPQVEVVDGQPVLVFSCTAADLARVAAGPPPATVPGGCWRSSMTSAAASSARSATRSPCGTTTATA
jgi:hypothetical protein